MFLLIFLQIAAYANVIINGVYWAPKNPRLLTYEDALMLLEPKSELDTFSGCPDLPHTLLAICDISADLGVSFLSLKFVVISSVHHPEILGIQAVSHPPLPS